MDEGLNLSNIQRTIMDYDSAGYSFAEISNLLNGVVSPREVEKRIRDYLAESASRYNVVEQRARIVYKINKLYNTLEGMLSGFDGVKLAGPLAKLLDNMESMLKMELPNIDEHMRLVNKATAVLFVEMLSLSNERAILEYARAHPEFDEADFRGRITEALPLAVERLNARTAIE